MALSNCRALNQATPSEDWTFGKSGSSSAALAKRTAARAKRSLARAGVGLWACNTPRLR